MPGQDKQSIIALLWVAGEDKQLITEMVLFMKKNFRIIKILTLTVIIFLLFFGPLGFRPNKQEINQTDADISIALFGTEGCESCQVVKEFLLPELSKQYPQIKVHYFDLDDLNNYQKLVLLEKKC